MASITLTFQDSDDGGFTVDIDGDKPDLDGKILPALARMTTAQIAVTACLGYLEELDNA
jgi:hypothetical protein